MKNRVWNQTYTCKQFYPLEPRVEDVCIRDIAHSLSMLCRFNGHTKTFHSVAQHCVMVSDLCPENRLWGLLHDASEAYIADFSSPLKNSGYFENYKQVEKQIQKVICQKFRLPNEEPAEIKRADLIVLATEARDLMSPVHSEFRLDYEPLPEIIVPLPPGEAEQLFLNRFRELVGSHKREMVRCSVCQGSGIVAHSQMEYCTEQCWRCKGNRLIETMIPLAGYIDDEHDVIH
jgi:5'-nucleotidase